MEPGLALRYWQRLPRARIWRMTELSKARCGVGKERSTVRCAEEIDGEQKMLTKNSDVWASSAFKKTRLRQELFPDSCIVVKQMGLLSFPPSWRKGPPGADQRTQFT